ncbi:sensor histidine kinase [Marilutibacter spongiae]|uniref:Sensor histidine kinase n=1 Tax=Marilutibacter spongiae TaxID=2025720 RepID=A0A7W3TM69_9GAMM|nr:sensor histidine kinase [Lysobacter spongiae]MBB1060896.1 sensor histidine kinase [Lysobacter spongiae]
MARWQSNRMMQALLRARRALLTDHFDLGWMPIYSLGYLLFLFLPVVFGFRASIWIPDGGRDGLLWPTLLSIALFLPLYFATYRTSGGWRIACTLAIALLGFGLMPANGFSNTYLIYACSFSAAWQTGMPAKLLAIVAMLALYGLELHLLRYPMFILGITAVVGLSVFFGNHFYYRDKHKQAALRLSHEEVKRLAATAERERIGRDLHDLLGHTLSLIALKSDLAGRLLERDPAAARHEVDEVSRVAREALSQVRRAVTGIRSAGIAAELASARLLLETDGITLRHHADLPPLPAAHEVALAMCLREAVTNLQRHARATQAQVLLEADGTDVRLSVSDNGRGGDIVPGNGLGGMRERLEALGGELRVEGRRGQGTRVDVRLPLPPDAGPPADGQEGTLLP